MNVLVLNCGSSTVKYRLLAIDPTGAERRLAGETFDVPAGDHQVTAGRVYLGSCGLLLDRCANTAAIGVEARITAPDARLAAFVIPTAEEAVIPRDSMRCLEEGAPGSKPAP